MTKRILFTLLLFTFLTSACSPASHPAPTVDANAAMTQAFATVNAEMTATASASAPTGTPLPTPTVPRTPQPLPPAYQSASLPANVTPHTYIADSCQYLRAKWDPNNAAPGTVVIVVMIHGIVKGAETSTAFDTIGGGDFKKMMNALHKMDFAAINMQQLEGFLYDNAKIPARSVVLIQDDRKTGENFNTWFRPYWQEWGWPVVNAWINQPSYLDPNWADNIALEKEGMVDHQSHGVVHNLNMSDNSTDEYIRSELQGSIDGMQEYYGKTPIAIIWPGGWYGARPVQIARQLGYKLGFTVLPRGPLMFNWIPGADVSIPGNPYPPEGSINDPLMTLPRFWDIEAASKLDEVRRTGNEAAAYAEQNKAAELDYYDIVCAPTLGPIPAPDP